MGYSTPNMSQIRVCSADLAFVAGAAAGVSTALTRTGGLLLRLTGLGGALALGATDLRFFGGDLLGRFAFGAVDLRFFAGAFVVLFFTVILRLLSAHSLADRVRATRQ